MPPAVRWRSSLFGAAAGSVAYQSAQWLDQAVATNDKNRHFLKSFLDAKLPQICYRIPDFSYLAWLDLTALNLGVDPFQRLLDEAKVAFNSGATFSPSHTQFVRLNFGTSEDNIEEAVTRIGRLLG
jgi:cystathionine beta-lyase